MSAPEPEVSAAAPLADPQSAVRLRGDPPRVMRLSRKAIGMASACCFACGRGADLCAATPGPQRRRGTLQHRQRRSGGQPCRSAQGLRPGAQARPGTARRSWQADPMHSGAATLRPCRRSVLGRPPHRTRPSAQRKPPGNAPSRSARRRAAAGCSSVAAPRGIRGGFAGLPRSAGESAAAPPAAPQSGCRPATGLS